MSAAQQIDAALRALAHLERAVLVSRDDLPMLELEDFEIRAHALRGAIRALASPVDPALDTPAPTVDEAELAELHEKGARAWAGVPDATAWVEEMRGNGQAPAANSEASPWHDAVLAACMSIECAYQEADPSRTLHDLIEWHRLDATAVREPLTDWEIVDLYRAWDDLPGAASMADFARMVEAKHGIQGKS